MKKQGETQKGGTEQGCKQQETHGNEVTAEQRETIMAEIDEIKETLTQIQRALTRM